MADVSLSSAPPARAPAARERSRRSGRPLWALAIALIVAGSLALADGAVTLLWQEPVTALIATLRQDHLRGVLSEVERAPPTPAQERVLASLGDEQRRVAFLASELDRHSGHGAPVGRIVIPGIGASFVLVKGTGSDDLKSGPGIYSGTSLPGFSTTTAIAGHRTTYLAPFRHIDSLVRGERILLEMPYARFTYTVLTQRVVAPTDVAAVLGPAGYQRLVLSACTPLFSAAKRLLVYAKLTRISPVGAARFLPGGAIAHAYAPATATPSRALPAMLESLDPRSVGAIPSA